MVVEGVDVIIVVVLVVGADDDVFSVVVVGVACNKVLAPLLLQRLLASMCAQIGRTTSPGSCCLQRIQKRRRRNKIIRDECNS